MVDLTELNGVGPARSESLEEAGYDDFETLADADAEQLAEDAEITEDKALDFIVQSQNIVAEEEAEVEESKPVTEEVAEAVEESEDEEDVEVEEETITVDRDEGESDDAEDEPEPEAEPEDDGPDVIEFELTFDEELEFDTFFDAVMGQRATMLRSNRDGVDAFDHALDQMRASSGVGATIELEMEEGQLNDLHNCVRQKMIAYKGDNLIDHMDALKAVLNDINDVRDEHLF